MSGGFSSLNTALTALRYNRVAMDVAGSNIANVTTDGYARRRVEGAAVAGPTQPALWSRYDGAGDGVQVTGVTRMTDELLNVRARREHGNQAYLDVRQASLESIENGLGEPGDSGVNAALADLRNSWHELSLNPSSQSAARPGAVQRPQRRRRDRRPGPQRRVRGGRPARPPAQRRERGQHGGLRAGRHQQGHRGRQPRRLRRRRPARQARPAHPAARRAHRSEGHGAQRRRRGRDRQRRTPRHRQPGRQPHRRLRGDPRRRQRRRRHHLRRRGRLRRHHRAVRA